MPVAQDQSAVLLAEQSKGRCRLGHALPMLCTKTPFILGRRGPPDLLAQAVNLLQQLGNLLVAAVLQCGAGSGLQHTHHVQTTCYTEVGTFKAWLGCCWQLSLPAHSSQC